MNLDDKDDYFLHDFDKDSGASGADTPAQSGQTVDFSASSSASAATEKPARRGGCRKILWWFMAFVVVVAAVAFSIRYMIPYTTDSRVRGYVESVEKRGIVFRTFECELITHSALEDSTRIYTRPVNFSVPDDSLARVLQSYQGTGRPVTVTLERYYGTLPWRGASTTVAVTVEPAM